MHQVPDKHTRYRRKFSLGRHTSCETIVEVHCPAGMCQNHDHLAVEEKQIAVVYPVKGLNKLFAH